ncbi:MAG: inositol monophosphatase family protein [Bacteroidales bacterium]
MNTDNHDELNLAFLLQKVIEISEKTADFIRSQSLKITQEDVEFKGAHDYVTYVDKTSEAQLVASLSELLPQAGFITEEGTSIKQGLRYHWIIDPLDGTTNFIHGIPFYCISIALQDKQAKSLDLPSSMPEGEIILGLVHHISSNEKFYSHKGIPAFVNGKEIHVSGKNDLENSLLATGFPYYDYERLSSYMKLLEYTMQHTAGVRRLGSAALDLAYVACGRCELFYEYGLRPWDVAAGQFLVKQAGGKVCDFNGGNQYLHGKEIVSANPTILSSFLKLLKQFIPSKLSLLFLLFLWVWPLCANSSTPSEDIKHKTSIPILYRYSIEEEIGPASTRITKNALKEAHKLHADILLLELNTFGGTLNSADEIRTLLLNESLPVYVYINTNAASAGALISIACDRIYMNPASSIGAATVVDQQGKIQAEKYQSYMRAMMRSTAQSTGRDPLIAEAMVDPRIYVPGIHDTGKVITFTAKEALKYGYSQGTYASIHELISSTELRNYKEVKQEIKATDKIIHFLIHPVVSGILIMLIIGGVYFELQSPGIGFALTVAIIAALLYFAPLYIEGLATHWEILIFLAGLILLAIEIFVIPGFGIAGISGIFCICTGLTLALIDNWGFNFRFVAPLRLLEAVAAVLMGTLTALIGGFFLSKRLFTKRVGRYALSLDTEQKREEGYISVNLPEHQRWLGSIAISESVLRPSGKIRIGESIYDATAESGFIDKGVEVRIMRFENAQFFVRKHIHA